MKNILFICTGNTCRSPMAEAILKHIGEGKFEVKSAGIFAFNGQEASIYTKQVLAEKDIPIEHSSATLQEEMLVWADYVLSMTNDHKQLITQSYPAYNDKVYTLYELIRKNSNDIADPYGGTLEEYRETLKEMEQLLLELKDVELS